MKSDYFHINIMGKNVDGKNSLFYIKSYSNETKIFPYPITLCIFSDYGSVFPASTNVECDNQMKVGQDEEIPQYQNIN